MTRLDWMGCERSGKARPVNAGSDRTGPDGTGAVQIGMAMQVLPARAWHGKEWTVIAGMVRRGAER